MSTNEVGSSTRVQAGIPSSSGAQISWRAARGEALTISRANYRGELEDDAVTWLAEFGVQLESDERADLALLGSQVALLGIEVELAVGRWESAYARFQAHILPVAASSGALTDAPRALWRLELAASGPVEFPWAPVRDTALSRMWSCHSPYVQLHNLLALAGARDLASLDRWLEAQAQHQCSPAEHTLVELGRGLRAFAAREYVSAASRFAAALTDLPVLLGGSRGQNQLFEQILKVVLQRDARERVQPVGPISDGLETRLPAPRPPDQPHPGRPSSDRRRCDRKAHHLDWVHRG